MIATPAGVCSCGIAVALHYDASNRMIGCAAAQRAADGRAPHTVVQSLTKRQLAARLQLSLTQLDFYRRTKTHPAIKQLNPDGPGHPRFCLETVEAWERGGRHAPTDLRRRRFFQSAAIPQSA